jgi:hypothetical protein
MKFRDRNLRAIAEMVIGDAEHFPYRSSSYITQFFEECDLDFVHDGSTRWWWTAQRLSELLMEPQPAPYALPERFVHVLRVLTHKSDSVEDDPDRALALEALNKPLSREGYEAFYGEDDLLYVRHIGTLTIQVKKGKLDASGASKGQNANIAEILNQISMMLGHEIFDPETSKKVLVDHAFIVAGGEITKQAKNWLGGKLDASKRSQILFMDREDILNLYVTSSLPLPSGAVANSPQDIDDDIPF